MSEGFRHPLLRTLVFGHVWLATGAAAQVWWMGRFTGAASGRSMLAIASALVAAYGLMRLVRSVEPIPLASPWILWVVRHRAPVIVLVLMASALSLYCAVGLRRVFAPFDLMAVPIVVLYLVPWLDRAGRSKGLRRIPWLKAPMIAAVWAMATLGLSAVDQPAPATSLLLNLVLLQFGFFLGLAIAFDSIDLPHDAPSLRTVPQLIGVRTTRFLAAGLMFPWMGALVVMQYQRGGFEATLALPILGYMLAAALLLRAGPKTPYWYGTIALDGLLILIPLLAWLGDRL